MERAKKGERYWSILFDRLFNDDGFCVIWHCEDWEDDVFSEIRFRQHNYFSSKEEAEAMARKLRAVLKGADVIEMPSEEDASFESEHLLGLSGHDGDDRTEEAYLDGFADCLHWIKSKVK